MIFCRHSFVAFIVIAAVVSVFFSPLVPDCGVVGRHHARANLALAASPAMLPAGTDFSFFSSITPKARAIRAEILIALNCVRLC